MLGLVLVAIAAAGPRLALLVEATLATRRPDTGDLLPRIESALLASRSALAAVAEGTGSTSLASVIATSVANQRGLTLVSAAEATAGHRSARLSLVARAGGGPPLRSTLVARSTSAGDWSLVLLGGIQGSGGHHPAAAVLRVAPGSVDSSEGGDRGWMVVDARGVRRGPTCWPLLVSSLPLAQRPAFVVHGGDHVRLDVEASASTPPDLPPALRLVGTWSVAGRTGSFGPGTGSGMPFVGCTLVEGPRLVVDLGSWSGPQRLVVAGRTAVTVALEAGGTSGAAAPGSVLSVDAPSVGLLRLSGRSPLPLALQAPVVELGDGAEAEGIVDTRELRVPGDARWHGPAWVRDRLVIDGRLDQPAPANPPEATFAAIGLRETRWSMVSPE